RALLDGEPIVIRLELLLVVEPADGAAVGKDPDCLLWSRAGLLLILVRTLMILVRTLTLDHEIGRSPVERHMELRIGHTRAVDDRLVVAGEQPARFAKLGDPHRPEIFLEKGARLVALERAGPRHPLADVLKGDGDRPGIAQLAPVKHLAACLEGREGRAMIVARPAAERGPLDRLKLAVRDI